MNIQIVRDVLAKRLSQAQRHHSQGFISAPQMQELRRFAAVIEKDFRDLEHSNGQGRDAQIRR